MRRSFTVSTRILPTCRQSGKAGQHRSMSVARADSEKLLIRKPQSASRKPRVSILRRKSHPEFRFVPITGNSPESVVVGK